MAAYRHFLLIDENYKVTGYPPQYLASQLITKEWVQPVDAPHKLFKVSSDVTDSAGNLTGHCLRRRAARRSVVRHAGQPGPVQRSRSEGGFQRC